jgi:hypothetical protein
MKEIIKRSLHKSFPKAAAAFFSARARAHSHRAIASWGCPAINEMLISQFGPRVLSGPFEGIILTPMTYKEQIGPYLLGLYEAELHQVWEQVLRRHYRQIIDIGAKFGYYAVGLARRFPGGRVIAFDSDYWARQALREMISANGIRNVEVARGCDFAWLVKCLEPGAFVLCDCDGYEGELFGKRQIPILASATVLIETHDVFVPGTTDRLCAVLEPTHQVVTIPSVSMPRTCPVDLGFLSARERELATQEIRPPQLYLYGMPRTDPSPASSIADDR